MSEWKSILVDWSKIDYGTRVEIAAACLSGDNLDKMALAEPENSVLCAQIVKNPNTWPITLTFMAEKCMESVRMMVAADARTPVETLKKMLESDESPAVRSAVSQNPNMAI